MSKDAAPLPTDIRQRALVRGLVSLAAGLAVLFVVAAALAPFHVNDRWRTGILQVALVVADAALVFSAWQLGIARDHRWDGRGWAALAALVVAWPALLMFLVYTAMAFYVLFTGQPFRPFGD